METNPQTNLAGLLRFGRYAYPPNRLGLCGGSDHQGLYQYLIESRERIDGGLRHLAVSFEAAYPYLQCIAHSVGIADPFDERVVEAYWLGNGLLDRVQAKDVHRLLDTMYRKLLTVNRYVWVQESVAQAAKPHHNFHVFSLYFFSQKQRIATQRTELVIRAIDRCRISWGTVTAILGDQLMVLRRPLAMVGDRWRLAAQESVTVDWGNGLDRAGMPRIKAGDIVSIHQGWMVEPISRQQCARLIRETSSAIGFANQHFGT